MGKYKVFYLSASKMLRQQFVLAPSKAIWRPIITDLSMNLPKILKNNKKKPENIFGLFLLIHKIDEKSSISTSYRKVFVSSSSLSIRDFSVEAGICRI